MADLMNQPFRIGVIDHHPFTSACAFDPVCPFRGTGVEMTRIVCQTLKMNCSFIPFGSAIYGTGFENGTGTGIIGAIQSGHFDTHLPNLTPNYDRYQAVDFSHAYTYSESILVTRGSRARTDKDLSWSILSAFTWKVWCAFLITLITIGILITIFTKHVTLARPLSFVGAILDTSFSLALINCQKEHHFKNRTSRILIIFWGSCMVVLSSAYGGMLFSNHIIMDTGAPFRDFETFIDCVESRKCVVVTPVLSIASVLYLTGQGSPHATRFEQAFKKNPIRVISKEDIANRILSEQDVFLTWPTARNDLAGSIDDKMRCSFTMVPMPQIAVATFPIRKGSRKLLEALNQMAFEVREHGIGVAVGLEPPDTECDSASSDSVQTNRVKLSLEKSLRIICYFYVIGVSVGVVVFVIELRIAKVLLGSRYFDVIR